MQSLLTRFRRELHRIPELDHDLPQTLTYLRQSLAPLPCRLFSPSPGALCAFFDGGHETSVAFRADMDALPLQEPKGRAYGSQYPGRMHACGHDGHMALALGLAHSWAEKRASLPHNLLLIFQPAEETTGGAQPLCESGILEEYRVKRIFGCHLWPGLPAGQAFARPGPMMARCSEITLAVQGRSAHIAQWTRGADALHAGALFLTEIYQRLSALPPSIDPFVLRFGRMESGSVRNAISDHTLLEGSLRVFHEALFQRILEEMEGLCRAIEAKTGCSLSLANSLGYPPLLNDPSLYAAGAAALGEKLSPLESPSLTADDFSFFAQARPSLFFFLGTGEAAPPLHNPAFDFDEAVLQSGLDIYWKLAALP